MSTQQPTPRVTAGFGIGRATGFELAAAVSEARPTSIPRSSATAPSPPRAVTKARSCSPTCACS
jgi:hypothetical protein